MPNSSDAGNPEDHENASNIDWNSNMVVVDAEFFDAEVDEESWDEICGKTESV